MKTNLGRRAVLIFVAGFLAVNAPCAEDLATKLQKGLFEEQANRDLNAAIKQYEEILKAAEDQRKIVATAMYRLAESYRKQGNEARANELYARLVRDYSDQVEIMQELEGWRETNEAPLAEEEEKPAISLPNLPEPGSHLAYAAELRALHKGLVSVRTEALPAVIPTVRTDSALNVLLEKWRSAKTILSREQAKPGADEARLTPIRSRVQALGQAIDERAREVLADLEAEAERTEKTGQSLLQQLNERLQEFPASARQKFQSKLKTQPRLREASANYNQLQRIIEALEGMADLDLMDQVALLNGVTRFTRMVPLGSALRDLNDLVREYEEEREKLAAKALPLTEQEASKAHVSEKKEQIANTVQGIITGLKILAEAEKAVLNAPWHSHPQLNWARDEIAKYTQAAPGGMLTTGGAEDRFAALEKLLKNSPDLLNAPATNDLTFLQHAAKTGNIPLAEFILSKGADLERKSSDGKTALHFAVEGAHLKMAETLIRAGAEVNARNSQGGTPLYTAAQMGFAEISEMLLEQGADANARALDRNRSWNGPTPLHAAAVRGHREVIRVLARNGADLNPVDSDSGATPLLSAIVRRQIQAALELLKAGADPNKRNVVTGIVTLHDRPPGDRSLSTQGQTPLTLAAQIGRDEITKALLEAGANPDATADNWTALHHAAAEGNAVSVKLLLASGASPDIQDGTGKAPLHYACGASFPKGPRFQSNPSEEILMLLIENKASLNLQDRNGFTPLHFASTQPDPKFVEQLLLAGANPNMHEEQLGFTPLHVASGAWHHPSSGPFPETRTEVTKMLLKHGADANVKDLNGATPLHYAQTPEIGRLLIAHGANVNMVTEKGRTPLDLSAAREAVAVILREAGGTNRIPEQEVNSNLTPGRAIRMRAPTPQ